MSSSHCTTSTNCRPSCSADVLPRTKSERELDNVIHDSGGGGVVGHSTRERCSKKQLSSFEHFLAGIYSGVIATIVGHPFDTIKVRLQSTQHVGTLQIIDELRSGRGFVRSVYKGVFSPLASVPLANALVFSGYETAKKALLPLTPSAATAAQIPSSSTEAKRPNPKLSTLALCGGFAGLLQSFVMAPVELIRIRLQVDKIGASKAESGNKYLNEVKKIYRADGGVRGLTRGLYATCIRDVPGFMIQFYVYEGMKRILGVSGTSERRTLADSAKLVAAGGTGGITGWFLTYPPDVVKTRVQLSTSQSSSFDGGFWRYGREIWAKEGYRAFFRGVTPCLLRALPVNGFGFLAYEQAAGWFRRSEYEACSYS